MHHFFLWGLPGLIILGLIVYAAYRSAQRQDRLIAALDAQQAVMRDQVRMLERIAIAQEARK